MEFVRYYFDPITFDSYLQYFYLRFAYESIDEASHDFNSWLVGYCKKARVYTRSQYDRHQELTLEFFRRSYDLPLERDPGELGLEIEWENWKSDYGLMAHFDEMKTQIAQLEGMSEWAGIESDIPSTYTLGELHKRMISQISRVSDRRKPATKEINELWFNSTISNSSDLIAELKKLPYEKYLRSEHWQKVRAAMLLIHGAVCQAEEHYITGESWTFGWESELDVHHLNYRNKGNERYSDLALLCKMHHEKWHNEISIRGEPSFDILDDSWH